MIIVELLRTIRTIGRVLSCSWGLLAELTISQGRERERVGVQRHLRELSVMLG